MLRLLGTPHYAGDGAILTDLPEKAFVLAALLAMEDGGPIRATGCALLWEEAAAPAAADNLR